MYVKTPRCPPPPRTCPAPPPARAAAVNPEGSGRRRPLALRERARGSPERPPPPPRRTDKGSAGNEGRRGKGRAGLAGGAAERPAVRELPPAGAAASGIGRGRAGQSLSVLGRAGGEGLSVVTGSAVCFDLILCRCGEDVQSEYS